MFKSLKDKISKDSQNSAYYICDDLARSYRDFGVPYSLAVEWICSKVNVGEEIVERACQQVYYLSKD